MVGIDFCRSELFVAERSAAAAVETGKEFRAGGLLCGVYSYPL